MASCNCAELLPQLQGASNPPKSGWMGLPVPMNQPAVELQQSPTYSLGRGMYIYCIQDYFACAGRILAVNN